MEKITPHLWFDKQALEAAEFYTSAFSQIAPGNTGTLHTSQLHDTPSGSVDTATIQLVGHEFRLISAGPLFKFNPSISFLVACNSKDEVDALWARLSDQGKPLMELGAYPFSERYGWTEDRYGLSWQVIYVPGLATAQRIVPSLMFVGEVVGKAEEAMRFYTSVFRGSKVGAIERYGTDEAPDQTGTVKHAFFTLEGQEFAAMDSARAHQFKFNEAVSLMVHCDKQEEIDYYWAKLSADPSAEACGWLKDRYGVSWQIVPTVMDAMFREGDPEKLALVTQAFLKMKKFDIAELTRAYEGGGA